MNSTLFRQTNAAPRWIIFKRDLLIIKQSYFKWSKLCLISFKTLLKNSYLKCCAASDRELINVALPLPQNSPIRDVWIGMEPFLSPIN